MVSLVLTSKLSYDNLIVVSLSKGIGLHGGLFHVTSLTQSFNLFLFLISATILTLTSFYPRKPDFAQDSDLGLESSLETSNADRELLTTGEQSKPELSLDNPEIRNANSEQFTIPEYSLIIVFVLNGAVFLMSASDLVSIFLAIELQSYGLYIICTLYRDSEQATSGGLTYFLLGGLSSCFILLGSSLLYANSGTTNLEGIYVISSISEVYPDLYPMLLSWYNPYYIHLSLIILSVGFLFKIGAAPFHFWSPEQWSGKSLALALCSRDKLPNSGEALELKVPSYSLKAISGWSNYSCMVTSLKTSEKKGGNRGSKSVTSLSYDFFQEKPLNYKL